MEFCWVLFRANGPLVKPDATVNHMVNPYYVTVNNCPIPSYLHVFPSEFRMFTSLSLGKQAASQARN